MAEAKFTVAGLANITPKQNLKFDRIDIDMSTPGLIAVRFFAKGIEQVNFTESFDAGDNLTLHTCRGRLKLTEES